ASESDVEKARFRVTAAKAQLDTHLSEIEVARARVAVHRKQLESTRVVAPFDGVVTEQSAQVGEIVSPSSAGGSFTRTGICTLVDLGSLEGEVLVNERHIARV